MLMDIASGENPARTWEVPAPVGEMQPDCHQSKIGISDASSMSLCKIFCSATGHALTTDIVVALTSITPTVQVAFLSDRVFTRQLVVEQHPPK